MKKLLTILLFFTLSNTSILAQEIDVDPEAAKKELEKRGLEEDDVRKKLEEKGIDINNINPANIDEVEKALEETINELEKENQNAVIEAAEQTAQDAVDQELDNVTDDVVEKKLEGAAQQADEVIKAAIDEGKDVEVAIAETLIDAQVDQETPIYGQHIFKNQEIQIFGETDDIKPPESYVLGVGDKITIQIWGPSQYTRSFTIDQGGFIKPEDMTRIALKGVTLAKARKLLRSRFQQYYNFSAGEFEMTINYSRNITINIVGEVENPGSFTIPATNTAFNAIVAAKGPSAIGSVRNIQLMRSGAKTKRLDVYEFLLNPSIAQNFYLQDNDYIHIPIVGKLVTISGSIRKPYTYELINQENLLQLIEFSGGFKDNAYKGSVQVKRFIDDEEKLIDVNLKSLKEQGKDFELFSGDVVTVRQIATPYKNFARVEGQVEFPGKYEISKNMRIRDLVIKGNILEEARTDVAYLRRTNTDQTIDLIKINLNKAIENPTSDDNFIIQPKDKLIIYSKGRYTQKATFSVSGAVRNPDKFDFDPNGNIKLEDAVTLSGGLRADATEFAYIARTNPANTKETEFIRVNINNALTNPSSIDNIKLQALDRVFVYSKETFSEAFDVKTGGAVRQPGSWKWDEGLKISDVIYFSGGLRRDANDFAYITRTDPSNRKHTEYIRINIKEVIENPTGKDNLILMPFDQLTVYSNLPFTDQSTVSIKGAVRIPTEIQYSETLTLKDALTFAGGLKLEAANSRVEISRVVIDDDKTTEIVVATVRVDDDLNMVSGELSDINLQPFDQIHVRYAAEFELQQNVVIRGEVRYPGAYPLIDKTEQLTSLVQRAGGLTLGAFPAGATLHRYQDNIGLIVMNLEEAMESRNSKFNFILKAGDIIMIPKQKDFVTVKGATRAIEIYPERMIADGNKVTVPYHKGKNAKFYIDQYAAGIGENGRSSLVTVEHPNGEIEKTHSFLFFKSYPSIRKGSIVTVGAKPKQEKGKDGKVKKDVNWGKVVADSIAQAISILTLIILIQRI